MAEKERTYDYMCIITILRIEVYSQKVSTAASHIFNSVFQYQINLLDMRSFDKMYSVRFPSLTYLMNYGKSTIYTMPIRKLVLHNNFL